MTDRLPVYKKHLIYTILIVGGFVAYRMAVAEPCMKTYKNPCTQPHPVRIKTKFTTWEECSQHHLDCEQNEKGFWIPRTFPPAYRPTQPIYQPRGHQ